MLARATAAAVACTLLVAGCDKAKAVAARMGIAGFEARCEAALPATRIDVVTAPVVYATDRTRSWRELTAMSGDATPTQRALGLTTAQVGHKVWVETTGIEDKRSGRVCVRPSIRVELAAAPMTVFVGREVAGDPCRDPLTVEHELKHVAVYEDELPRIADDVRAWLESSYANRILYYRSRAEAQRETEFALNAEISPMLADTAQRIKERQRTIDSPEEYARVSAACGGATKD